MNFPTGDRVLSNYLLGFPAQRKQSYHRTSHERMSPFPILLSTIAEGPEMAAGGGGWGGARGRGKESVSRWVGWRGQVKKTYHGMNTEKLIPTGHPNF